MEMILPLQKTFNKLVTVQTDPLVFMQIVPDASIISNGRKVEQIIDSLHYMQKSFFDRIRFTKNGVIYKTKDYAIYTIFYSATNIKFIIAIPSLWQNFITQRIYSVFPNCTIRPFYDYLGEFDTTKTVEYKVIQKEHYFKSINTDYRENAPIPSLLAIQKDIQNDDKMIIEMILEPVDSYWKQEAENVRKKYMKGEQKDKPENIIESAFLKINKIIDSFFGFMDLMLNVDIPKEKLYTDKIKFESYTNQKINYNAFDVHMRILSQSDDIVKRDLNAKTVEIALTDVAGDNELTIKKCKTKIDRKKPIIKINGNMLLTTKEIAQFQQLPTFNLQREYPIVESIDTREINLPKKLFEKGIPIGIIKYKGSTREANWNIKDRDIAALSKAIFGPQGFGKTEYLVNFAINALKLGQSVFVPDGIRNCELANKIRDYSPTETKTIDLNFGSNYIIPLFWNEIIDSIRLSKEPSEKLKLANKVTQQLMLFLDSLVEDTPQKLTPRMKRYLTAAGLLVFSQSNTTMVDILNVLVDYDIRKEFIKNSGLSEGNKIIQDLKMLDGHGDTKINDIKGIVDRLDLLLGDYVLSSIFSTKTSNKLDFVKYMNEGYLVTLKMPQTELSDGTIDTLITFILSKIWLASIMRGNDQKVAHVIVDEIHRYPTATKILDNIREMRKNNLSYFFSAHQPSDFKKLLPTLKSAGSSYMLLNTSVENLRYFEQEIKPFTIEECAETKKYHAKCIVNYDKEFTVFDAELPAQASDKYQFIDRVYLEKECLRKYGIKYDL